MSLIRVQVRVLAASLLAVGLAACNDKQVAAPDAPPTTTADTVRATFTFDRPMSDAEVKKFLADHKFHVSRYLLYGAGLFGADGNAFAPDSLGSMTAVRTRLIRAATLAATSIDTRRDSLSANAWQYTEEELAESAVRLLALRDAHQVLSNMSATQQPLIWGVRVGGTASQVQRAAGAVHVQAVSSSAARIVPSSTLPPPALIPLAALHPPTVARRAQALRWLRAAVTVQASAAPRVAATTETFYPNSGDLWYDGDAYFNTSLRWNNPGNWPSVKGLGLEIDLVLDQAFFSSPWGVYAPPCATYTDLPTPYDDCPTAGVLDGKQYSFSFGTFRPRAIVANRTYFGGWYFWGVGTATTKLGLVAQPNENKYCPWLGDNPDSPWCMNSVNYFTLLSTTTNSVAKGTKSFRTFPAARAPTISSISPSNVVAGVPTSLTVVGTTIAPSVRVTVNGTPIASANVQYVTSTRLRVNVTMQGNPPFTAALVLQNPDGQTATGVFQVSPSSYPVTVTGSGAGRGTVTGGIINCAVNAGAISGTCSATPAAGSTLTLTATPASGHTFGGWSGDCSGTGSCQLTMSKARAVAASFMPPVVSNYLISLTSNPTGGGTTTGSGTFPANTTVTVTASAANGYRFVNWTESGVQVSVDASYQFSVTANRSLVANFASTAASTYVISLSSNPTGGGSTSGGGTVPANSAVTVTASPAGGYSFVNWTESGVQVSPSASYTFTATANRSLVANFASTAASTYVISLSSNPSGGGTTSGGGTVPANSAVTVTASPGSGYSFVNWTESGIQVSPSANYTFTATANRSLVANFAVSAPSDGPQAIAIGLNRPWNLATDGSRIFWVENSNTVGAVRSMALTGGNATTLATGLVEPSAIAVDGSFVFWIERNNGSNGSLKRLPKTGGSLVTLASGLTNAQNRIALDASHVYFGDGKPGGGGAMRRVAKAGGSVETLVNDNINLTPAVAVDNGYLYYHDDRGNVKRVSVGGGASTTLGSGSPSDIIVVGSTIFWTEYNTGAVKRMPVTGGGVSTIATRGTGASGLASDGTNVYWILYENPGAVYKTSVNGGAVTTIWTEANTIGIVLDGAYVYWAVNINSSGGKIMKAPK